MLSVLMLVRFLFCLTIICVFRALVFLLFLVDVVVVVVAAVAAVVVVGLVSVCW